MPCHDNQNEYEDAEKINKLTRMLCGLCARLEKESVSSKFLAPDPELEAWWHEHKREDAARHVREFEKAEKERIRQAVINRMTPQERRIFGV